MNRNKSREERIEDLLTKHKKWITKLSKISREDLSKQENYYVIQKVQQQARILSLVKGNFECQKCKKEHDLTYHHLIMRKAKNYMPFSQYISQRNFWANIIILCLDCHTQYHKEVDSEVKPVPEVPISQELIEKLKEKWGKMTKLSKRGKEEWNDDEEYIAFNKKLEKEWKFNKEDTEEKKE